MVSNTVQEITCPANIYLFKVNNKNTRKSCEICSKLTTKTLEWRLTSSGVFTVNFEHIFSVSIAHFRQVDISWVKFSEVVTNVF